MTGIDETDGARTLAERAVPEAFEDLTPWLDWALQTERARTEKGVASSMEDIRALYDTALPRLKAIIRYLEDFRVGDMPSPARNLYLISLSFVEIANLVELHKRREVIERPRADYGDGIVAEHGVGTGQSLRRGERASEFLDRAFTRFPHCL